MVLFQWSGEQQQLIQVYNVEEMPTDWSGLTWSGGVTTVPSGVPSCGWEGEYCLPPQPLLSVKDAIGLYANITLLVHSLTN